MKKLILILTAAGLANIGLAFAQDQLPVDEQGVPIAPEVVPPGWPPPEDLCATEPTFDFEREPTNPGLQTTEQFRTWSIGGVDQGNLNHLFLLGLMHEYGRGVLHDQRRAKDYYKKAADLGNTRAMVRLGKYYCRQELYCLAAQNFHKAAMRDDGAGQMMLSRLYRWGRGVYYDPVSAYKWGFIAMEKTDGNWLVHDYDGVIYLRELERIITEDEAKRAAAMIDDWRRGFNQQPVACRED